MKTNYIQQLAKNVAAEKEISASTANFVLDALTRSQQKAFLKALRTFRMRDTLYVTSVSQIEADTEKKLLAHFGKKYIENTVDPKIGAGLVIKNNDDIIDLSLTGEIRRFIHTIA